MTNFSGENLNAACGGPQGGGVDSRRNGVSEVSSKYLTEIASNPTPLGYKQTEVGMIPEDWEVKTVFELVDYQKSLFDDGDWIEAEHITSKGIRLIQTGNIGVGRYVEKDAKKYIFEESFEKLKCKELHEGDLLICRLAEPAGRACILPDIGEDKVITSVDVTIFRPSPELANREFYNQYFSSSDWFKSVLEQVGGTTHKRISRGALGRISVCYPNVEEQTAIANALSDVDALISELEKLIAKKQAIKTATMQQLLTGRTRLPQFALREDGTPTNSSGTNLNAGTGGPKGEGHDGLRKSTKPSELGEIPEDWDAIKMGDLAKIQRGASPRPIDSPIWFERNSTVGWLRISDVTKTSKYLTETTQSLSELGIANSRFVPENNLVMSICATVGKPIITKKDLCIHDGFVVFNGLSVNQDFMYYILKELEDEWSKQGQTGSQMNLNTDLINGTYVAVPKDKTEQTAIATILSDMDEEIQALEQRLGKTRQIKQGMMQELLTGKTRLIKPSKEVIHE